MRGFYFMRQAIDFLFGFCCVAHFDYNNSIQLLYLTDFTDLHGKNL